MPRHDFEDDGRTVADMNVPGMRWHQNKQTPADGAQRQPLGARDARRAALFATLAALLVAACFLVAFALFILFCTNVWFR